MYISKLYTLCNKIDLSKNSLKKARIEQTKKGKQKKQGLKQDDSGLIILLWLYSCNIIIRVANMDKKSIITTLYIYRDT